MQHLNQVNAMPSSKKGLFCLPQVWRICRVSKLVLAPVSSRLYTQQSYRRLLYTVGASAHALASSFVQLMHCILLVSILLILSNVTKEKLFGFDMIINHFFCNEVRKSKYP